MVETTTDEMIRRLEIDLKASTGVIENLKAAMAEILANRQSLKCPSCGHDQFEPEREEQYRSASDRLQFQRYTCRKCRSLVILAFTHSERS